MRWVTVLLVSRSVRGHPRWSTITACVLAGFVLLPVIAGAIAGGEGQDSLDLAWQSILQAHPEWPADVRAAVVAGIICAGMPADMVRAAWGAPTRTSGPVGPGQLETWHYEGRPNALERIAGRGRDAAGSSEWTVSFINGQVVGWTD
jgi:hypothetical protein